MELTIKQIMILMAVGIILVVLITLFTNKLNPLLIILAVAAAILIVPNAILMTKRK